MIKNDEIDVRDTCTTQSSMFPEFVKHVRDTKFSPMKGRLNLLAGLVSETGSILNAYKRRFEDQNFDVEDFKQELMEEVGDALWYLVAIALESGVDIYDAIRFNMKKTEGFHRAKGRVDDSGFPEYERFPENLTFEFRLTDDDAVILRVNDVNIGDRLNDNAYLPDNYKFHDIIHISFAAILGWSPVMRHILKLKRKSDKSIDENEDGARARIIEEAIAIFVFSETQKGIYCKQNIPICNIEVPRKIDFRILNTIKRITKGLEVSSCTPKLWEEAIIKGYNVWDQLIKKRGGKVFVDFVGGTVEYVEEK